MLDTPILSDLVRNPQGRVARRIAEVGEIALRGGIVDVFPLTSPWPVRLEVFGDELESLRTFDPVSQMSRDSIESVREAVDRIHASLQRQSESCRNAATSLSEVFERTRSNDEATDVLGAAAQALQQQAKALRDDVNKFRLA